MTATVIFDLDGTLADTSGDLLAAANACFKAAGYAPPLDLKRDQMTAFRGGRAMLRLGLSRLGGEDEDKVDRWYPDLIEFYQQDIDTHTTLYPGCIAAVDTLIAEGYKVGICTNKPGKQAETLMTRLGVRDRFGSLIAADTLPVRKPDPLPYFAAVEGAGGDRSRSLLVGDTETDEQTARAAGVPIVLVGFGPEGEGISRLQPDAILQSYDDMLAVTQRLIGPPKV